MRVILYRGLQRRKGELVRLDGTPAEPLWFYGGVLQGPGDHSIIYDEDGKHPVYTDTIGGYTGFDDADGKHIFESDILQVLCKVDDALNPTQKCVEERYIVVWDEEMGCWKVDLLTGDTNRITFPSLGDMFVGNESGALTVRVLGNKFDNPEFLGETPASSETIKSQKTCCVPIDDVRRGLTDGDIIIGMEDNNVVAELGDCIIHFCDSDDDSIAETASVHIDTTPFEEDVMAICDAINAMPDEKIRYCASKLHERFRERDSRFRPDQLVDYPHRDQVANAYEYLNWESSHKNPYDMTDEELRMAIHELLHCSVPGFSWVAQAGYKTKVLQDNQTGKLILPKPAEE